MAAIQTARHIEIMFSTDRFAIDVEIDPGGRCVVVPCIWTQPRRPSESRPSSLRGGHVTSTQPVLRMPARWQATGQVAIDVTALISTDTVLEIEGTRYCVTDKQDTGMDRGAGSVMTLIVRKVK